MPTKRKKKRELEESATDAINRRISPSKGVDDCTSWRKYCNARETVSPIEIRREYFETEEAATRCYAVWQVNHLFSFTQL